MRTAHAQTSLGERSLHMYILIFFVTWSNTLYMCRVSCLAVIFLEIEWAYSREKVAMGVVEMRVRVCGNTAIFFFFSFFLLGVRKK